MLAPKLHLTTSSAVPKTTAKAPEEPISLPESLLDEASAAVATPPRNGMISALIGASAALIAVAAWFFLSHLFADNTGSSPLPLTTPMPIATAKVTESPFVSSVDAQPQSEIRLPAMDAEDNSAALKPAADAALDTQPENSESTQESVQVAAKPSVMNASSASPERQRAVNKANNTPRPAVQITQNITAPVPRVEPPIAVIKAVPLPRVIEPAPPLVVQESNVKAASGSSITNPRLDPANPVSQVNIDNMQRQASSDTQAESGASEARNADNTPREVAPVVALVSPPDTAIKKPARRNSVNSGLSGLVVIVNKANSKVFSKSDISNIYRDRVTRWPSGERILVFNLPLDSSEAARFAAEVLEMTSMGAATQRSNRTITNRVQNETRTKNAQVIVSYVERNENAIGYVPAAAIADSDNVRVVFSIP